MQGLEDNDVVAVCGQQIVPHDHNMNPAQWFRPFSEPRITKYRFSESEFIVMSPVDLKRVCSWDNVTALYKRDILLNLPFERTIFAEDATWAKAALSSGYTIAYNYNARVYHYHHESPEFAYKRAFAEMYSTYKIFGLAPDVPRHSLWYYLRLAKVLVGTSTLTVKAKLYWWSYNLNLARAYRKAGKDFQTSLQLGQAELEQLYYKLCNYISAPEQQQPANNNQKK
ncbi:MAG: hypothetical protein K8F30_02770 [Taibaiella sp.]|nr:hypothetical protein [Taibaiella sp.]